MQREGCENTVKNPSSKDEGQELSRVERPKYLHLELTVASCAISD